MRISGKCRWYSYNKAIEAYAEAEKIGIKDKDYALLQSAISYGVQANYQNKAQLLKKLVKTLYSFTVLNQEELAKVMGLKQLA